jgi:hypothetical protein
MVLADPPDVGPRTVEVIRTEEKGSDVNLATHLLVDGFRSTYACAVIVSNDSDLAEPIRVIRSELGVPVGVVNPHRASKRSRAIDATFFRQVRPSALKRSQFAPVLEDAHGEFRKPERW